MLISFPGYENIYIDTKISLICAIVFMLWHFQDFLVKFGGHLGFCPKTERSTPNSVENFLELKKYVITISKMYGLFWFKFIPGLPYFWPSLTALLGFVRLFSYLYEAKSAFCL